MKIVWFLLRVLAVLIVGAVIGLDSAWLATGPDFVRYPIQNGAWRASANMGNSGDDIYLRAYNARVAWFSNDPDANIYYEAVQDSAGRPLDMHCTYEISGQRLPARWWSITAYSNFHWIANERNRFSFTSTTLDFDPNGVWRVIASPRAQDGAWLPLASAGRLTFLLRLYDLTPGVQHDAARLQVPSIERRSCP